MSLNPEFSTYTLDDLRGDLDNLAFAKHRKIDDYRDKFYDHLTGLIKYRILSNKNDVDELKLNFQMYRGLEQYTFENSMNVENTSPNEINWDFIDESKDIITKRVESLLKGNAKSDFLKPLKEFTVDMFENWLIYKNLHPLSFSNPWIPTQSILNKGYLFIVSDNRDLLDQYKSGLYKNKKEDETNLAMVTKGEERQMGGFLVDNRLGTQGLVFEYLRRQAKGKNQAKTTRKILDFLNSQDRILDEQTLKFRIILPLKRSGLIGSTTAGYFHIDDEFDLIQSYLHHKEKLVGLEKTIEMYKDKALKMGIKDLDYLAMNWSDRHSMPD